MKKYIFAIIIAFIGVGAQLVQPHPAQAFSDELMMDDTVFDAVNSMNEAQIRDFINTSHAGSCLQTSGAIFPEPIDYFTYKDGLSGRPNNPVDAARVIFLASQYSGINPQVVLATLQKEQTLITRTDCLEHPSGIDSRNKAMGMGCPDSGPCPAPAYAGFQQQVMKGAWQLAFNRQRSVGNTTWGDNGGITYYGYMTKGTFKRCDTCASIFYDGYSSPLIDGQSIFISNGPTASFYTYTPHLHQALPGIFEGWFGPTTTGLNQVYRMANYITHERLLTVNAAEKTSLTGKNGWVYEGVAFQVPQTGGIPVYRLANYITHERLLTVNGAEKDSIAGKNGWVFENVAFVVPSNGFLPVYRLANYITHERLLTANGAEKDSIKGKNGWVDEGIAFQVSN
jgi:hypothetical protein